MYFCEFCKVFKNTFFTEQLRMTAPVFERYRRKRNLKKQKYLQFYLVKFRIFIKGCLAVILRGMLHVETPVGLQMNSLDVLANVPII